MDVFGYVRLAAKLRLRDQNAGMHFTKIFSIYYLILYSMSATLFWRKKFVRFFNFSFFFISLFYFGVGFLVFIWNIHLSSFHWIFGADGNAGKQLTIYKCSIYRRKCILFCAILCFIRFIFDTSHEICLLNSPYWSTLSFTEQSIKEFFSLS